MGFNKVYKSLKEIFPQIDARALRAVAIEHRKDVDAAVEAVLVEIIPFFSELSRPSTPATMSVGAGESSRGATFTAQNPACTSVTVAAGSTAAKNGYVVNVGYQESFSDATDGYTEPLNDTHIGYREPEGKGLIAESTLSGSKSGIQSHDEADRLTNTDGVNALQVRVTVEPKTDQTTSDDKYSESSIQLASDDAFATVEASQGMDTGIDQDVTILGERAGHSCLEIEFDSSTNHVCNHGKSSEDGNTCAVGPASFIVHDSTESLPENNFPLSLHDNSARDLEESDLSLPCKSASKMESASNIIDIVDTDDDSTLNSSMSQSSKIHMIDAFGNIIVDARNNKKMLFSAIDSVISLMREVELKEKAAEQAKVEAAMCDTDILVKREELKQMVKRAEEANSMHAGEVYGEKSILATELRELQSRAFSLSVERDKYLAILNEMQQTVEVRLVEAQNVIKSAELQKIEKENAAVEALTQQKLIIEKVFQESKILNQQAEDNAKLREFLVDRGRVVDSLQGEISVICQDVRILKETLDDHIPFSKSLSSSQTSCILALSGSSSKSVIREQVESLPDEEANLSDTQEKEGVFPRPSEHSSKDEAARNDHKALSDDEWEIFERDMHFE